MSRRRAYGRRARRTLGLAIALLIVAAGPAAADPAGPTNYVSRVQTVTPPDAPVEAEVLGGDAFMVLHAEPGATVEVPGYEGEPYLRFEPDGTVLVNERSTARWLNDARYGERAVEVPPQADNDAAPAFIEVADGGTYAWHDHRIHFMSPGLPSQVDAGAGGRQPVNDWQLPLQVDGGEVVVSGDLVWEAGPSPVVVGLLILGALVLAGLLAWRFTRATVVVVAVAALLAAGTALAANVGLPPGMEAQSVPVVLGLLALGLAGLGAVLARRGDAEQVRGRLVTAAAGVPLLVWVVLHVGAMTRPIVPGPLPAGVVRLVVLLAAAAGLAAVALLVRTVLAATSLDAGPDEPA